MALVPGEIVDDENFTVVDIKTHSTAADVKGVLLQAKVTEDGYDVADTGDVGPFAMFYETQDFASGMYDDEDAKAGVVRGMIILGTSGSDIYDGCSVKPAPGGLVQVAAASDNGAFGPVVEHDANAAVVIL